MRRLTEFGPSLVVIATAALVLLAGPRLVRQLTFHQTEAQIVQARRALESTTVLDELNDAYRNIATMVEPSVVHISAFQRMPTVGGSSLSSGSGWVYDNDGYIVTNHHVVADVDRIDVQLHSGAIREAELIGFDASTDIAVLKIDPARLHPAVRAESSQAVEQGDLVFAFGSPFDFRFSISSGIVSGKGRHVGVIRDRIGNVGYENFIQVDAAINPGNFGGPLTDHRGRVIGMNTAIATGGTRGGLDEGQFAGIGLAIPLEMIEPVVDQIIDKGFVTKGFLGVEVDDLWPVDRRRLAFNGDGALIRNVQPGTPAFTSGVRIDDIVIAVDGAAIESRPQLQSKISSVLPGDTVELTIVRYDDQGQQSAEMTIPVMLTRLDSLKALTLAVEVENRFEVCLDPERDSELVTIHDLVAAVRKASDGD